MNFKIRWKNPWFYVFIISAVLTATGIDPTALTSWELVREALVDLAKNPFLLGTAALTVLGIFVDPTTYSLKDSAQAMGYNTPKKD